MKCSTIDNVEDFKSIIKFYKKFKDVNNVQMLVTTKDNSFRDKIPEEYKFADLKIDYFDHTQAKEYFKKSLKNYIENKESIIERVLKSEEQKAFLPHRLYFIVNYINYSHFDIEKYLRQICDKTIWDENDIYFEYFKRIEEENLLSMKILYFMSLMDPDKIQSSLINDLLNGEFDNNQTLQRAIDLLIKNGFIESVKTKKYFRIHRLTQNFIKLFKNKKGENNNHDIENKLLEALNKLFVCEIDFDGELLTKEEYNVRGHVHSLFENLRDKASFKHQYNYLVLKLNYGTFLLHLTYKNDIAGISMIEKCLPTVNKSDPDDIHVKIKIFHSYAFYYQKNFIFGEACKYSEEVLKMRRNLNADDDTKSIKIALYCVAVVDDQSDRYSEALEKLEELD